MSTNTFVTIDVASRHPPTCAVPAAAGRAHARKQRPGWRPLLGTCLLHLPRTAWMALDAVLACIGIAVGDRLFVWWQRDADSLADPRAWIANGALATSIVFAGCVVGLYESRTLWARSRIIARGLLAVGLAVTIAWGVLSLLAVSGLSRREIATGAVFYVSTACAIRLLAHGAIRDVRRGLLVIGQGPSTGLIVRAIRRGAAPGYELIGLVADSRGSTAARSGDIPVVGDLDDIEDICRRHHVAEVVVADRAAGQPAYERAALTCLRLGCRVTNETTFYESTFGEVPATQITPNWFLVADLKGQREEHATLKRIFDVAAAAIGLVLSAPLWPVIAAAIRLQGTGRVFYCQNRVGQCGRPFTLYKFRTMRDDAEADGWTWAAPDDPRVTRVGRFMRRTRLDELPQLWNILRGDMSVVGPRPERPEFVAPLSSFIPFYAERHLVKPGLTGWAQINYRYGASLSDARKKLQYDLYYIKHMSFELDLVILLRTLGTFFQGAC